MVAGIASAKVAAGASQEFLPAEVAAGAPSVEVAADAYISCQEFQEPEADGGPDDKFSLAPTDPVAPPMSVGQLQQISRLRRRGRLYRLVQRKLRAWTRRLRAWMWPGCVRRRGRDYPHRRWQDQMRDKSIQCDYRKLHRLVQEAACEDAVAAYVDVAGFFFNVVKKDIICEKISAARRRWSVSSKV